MDIFLLAVIAATSTLAALFAFLGYLRCLKASSSGPQLQPIENLIRTESQLMRQATDESARGVRSELGQSIQRFQDSTLHAFAALGETLRAQMKEAGDRLDSGVLSIDNRVSGIGSKLDADMRRMADEANANREALKGSIESKLDDAATKQASTARETREELATRFAEFGDNVATTIAQYGDHQKERLANVGSALTVLTENMDRSHQALKGSIEGRLDDAAIKQVSTARETREELANRFAAFGDSVAVTMAQHGDHQKERLANVGSALTVLTENMDRSQQALRTTVEGRLDLLRQENSSKLDEMRQTVDERLQNTLDARLGESFNRVVEHLQRVHEGIGQMQALAADVGDLSRVLSNVRVRGTLGEVQLEGLLEQFLAPQQYIKNAQVKDGSQERVEFAIKFPGRDGINEVLLPVDAKFPRDDFERLLLAVEANDLPSVAEAGKALEAKIRACAKDIRDKYINVPRTTEFAVLFLPVEGLYAEVLRRPGLFEALHREYRVTLAGPTTLCALLNAFQMGFKSLALEKRSSEVWQVLGAVQTEFQKYNGVVEKLGNQLSTAANSVGELGKRTRIMSQKLRAVEKPPEAIELPPVQEAPRNGIRKSGAGLDELMELMRAPDLEEVQF